MKMFSNTEDDLYQFEFQLSNEQMQLIKSLDICNAKSFSEIRIKLDILGKDIFRELIYFFLFGGLFSAKSFNFIYKALSSKSIIDQFIDDDFLNILFAIYNIKTTDRQLFNYYSIWSELSGLNYQPFPREDNFIIKRKYQLIRLIDKRFPVKLLQFFDKNMRKVFRNDRSFANYMKKSVAQKMKENFTYKQIFDIILKKEADFNNVSMFLN